MKRQIASLVAVAIFASSIPVLAVGGDKAEYIGGTITSASLKEKTEGKLDTGNDTALVFAPEKKGMPSVSIPYATISELEYGQKAGRRVGMAIMINPLALFSKKRKHYFTIAYTDAGGKDQAVVFELGKDIVRTTLKIVETRSKKAITYQDEEARKSGVGGKG